MKNEDTRLDRTMAILEASGQSGCHADRWTALSKSISGLEPTGASDDVRQAIGSYGVSCNAIMQPYQTSKLPGEGPFDLFGDGVHEQVPRYFAQFFPDELDRIDDLIRNPDGNPYVRWASAGCYKYLVRDRAISMDDAVCRLDRIFNETKLVGNDGRPGLGDPYEVSSGIIEVIASIGGASRSEISESDSEHFIRRIKEYRPSRQ